MTGVDVSVVIPARNAGSTVGSALDALTAQHTERAWEVIVVDNGSSDATADVVETYRERLPHLRLAVCTRRGVNAARNTGLRLAAGDVVLCCDADDEVGAGWLEAMVDALGRFDVVGGRIDIEQLNPGFVGTTRINPVEDQLPTAGGYPYVIGASMGFLRTVFETIGGFDESFRSGGGDELDFCWRAQFAGFSVGLAENAVTHYRFVTTLSAFFKQQYHYELGSARAWSKHIALGHFPPPDRRAQRRALLRRARTTLRIDRLVARDQRWTYVRRLASFAGSVVSFARYRVLAV